MYLNYYQFKKEPFQITPDPEFLFLSPSHKEAMASIIYGIEGKKGFVAIVGGVGVGKTTILRSYLEKVNRDQLKIIYIFNANVSFGSLLKTIYQDLGVAPKTDDEFLMVNQLHEILIEEYKKGYNVVLIIDEAQNMPMETLENLRMLSNLETAKEKLVQIVLIGQPEFDEMLNKYELRQLKQRIAIRTVISPLTNEESLRYIEHRLSKVALKSEPTFTKGALKEIVTRAKGIPRVINILCDNALITGYGYQKKPVTGKIVKEVGGDFQEKKKEERPPFRWKTATGVVVVAAVVALSASPFGSRIGEQVWSHFKGYAENQTPVRIEVKSEPVAKTLPRQEAAVPKPEAASPPPELQQKQATAPTPKATVVSPVQATARPPAASVNNPGSRVVEKGDTLSRLIIQKYGAFDTELLQKVKSRNPGIKDVNKIYIGDTIVFPDERAGRNHGSR